MSLVIRRLVAALALIMLAGCASTYVLPKGEPIIYRDMAHAGARLDRATAAAAASLISDYRHYHGLPAVMLDPRLMRMAQAQADAMAQRDILAHSLIAPFATRLAASGFDASRAAEDIGAGYRSLAAAFAGWQVSPPHRANMLLAGATRMGVAVAYTPYSRYKIYWSLELAEPDTHQSAARWR